MKFLSLINGYYNSLTQLNKKIKEKQKIHNSVIDLINKLSKEILPKFENFEKLGELHEKKINKSKSDDETLFYLNKLINYIANKSKEITDSQKEEINRLHERVEFFINQSANIGLKNFG